MPIRPELRKFYRGKHWDAVRVRVLERCGNRCEHCGILHGARGWRDRTARFYPAAGPHWKRRAGSHKLIVIQLGVAHLNHVAGDDRDENLRALCRRCHLIYDAPHHKLTRAERKDRERPILALVIDPL